MLKYLFNLIYNFLNFSIAYYTWTHLVVVLIIEIVIYILMVFIC